MLTGCTLTLTEAELEAVCDGTSSLVENGLLRYLQHNATVVGAFGNADPLDASQWVDIHISKGSLSQSWDARTRTCVGLFANVEHRFLTADVGGYDNPQRKIVAAQVLYGKEDWTFRPRTRRTTQTFVVANTVTWVHLEDQALEAYTPPAPPVLLEVPYDVFYPFYIESGGRRRQ
ncbi:unnamed protein product, partial [Heterosigma akashiwo]